MPPIWIIRFRPGTFFLGFLIMQDFGKLILRLTVGGLMLFHGYAKIQDGGLNGITKMVTDQGWPEQIAYGVFIGEILAPLLLIIGWQTRFAAFIMVVNMGLAVFLAHIDDLTTITDRGTYRLEVQAFYFFCSLAIMCLGSGAFGLDGRDRERDLV